MSSIQVAVDILTALLTGGFLLFFIEVMHIESDVNQQFKAIMNPFYHKLSKLMVFISYMNSSLSIKTPCERWTKLMKDIDYIRRTGVVPCSSGRDVPYMDSEKLSTLCEIINDVWHQLESSTFRSQIVVDGGLLEHAKEGLLEVYPEYAAQAMSVDVLHRATGNFYIDYWQPVESCTSNYEHWGQKSKLTRIFIIGALGVTIISLTIVMLWAECISPVVPCLLALASIILFVLSIVMMFKLMSLKHNLFREV